MGISDLLELLTEYTPDDKLKIIRSFAFANSVHKGQKRKSGEDYIIHPLSVACILANNHVDADTISAGLLHDVIEDGDNVTKETISSFFNPTIAKLVDGVTKMKKLEFDNDKQMTDEANMRKIVESLLVDVRIFQVKLADRLHNMRTLEFHKPQKQKEISIETMELFVPFAGLIGAYENKMELQDLCFKYLQPTRYKKLEELLKKARLKYKKDIDVCIVGVCELLAMADIKFNFKFKEKNISELSRRIDTYHNVKDIHDLYAIKIIVDDIDTCYRVRDLITELYRVYEDKSKDYISVPKTNLYEALHVSIYGPHERLIQFQIVTEEMDKINSSGILAYWELIKSNNNITPDKKMQDAVEKFQFFESLIDIQNIKSNAEFNLSVKNDILARMIYVSLNDGRVIQIPEGSNLLDLAYKISGDMGSLLVYGKVNGEFVKNNFVLSNKDRVELIYNANFIGPKEDLSNQCVTEKAKRKIRNY